MAVRAAGPGSAVSAAPYGLTSSAVPAVVVPAAVVPVMAALVIVVLAAVVWLSRRIAAAGRAQRDSAARCRELADDWPDLVARYDQDCRRVYVNRVLERAYGIPREQLIGRPLPGPDDGIGQPGLDPASAALMRQKIGEVFERGSPTEFEVALRTPAGDLRFHSILVPELDQVGRVTEVLALGRDITVLKRVEQELAERAGRYRDVFDNALDGMYLLEVMPDGPHFRVLEQNPALERSSGIPRSQTIGRLFEDALPPEACAVLIPWLRRCVETALPLESFDVLDLPSGRRRYHATIVPARDDRGRVYRIVGISRDITQHWEAERALAASEERFRLAFDDSLVGMAQLAVQSDPHFRHLRVNRAMCEFLGRSEEDLLRVRQSEVLCAEDAAAAERAYEALLSGELSSYRAEHCFRQPRGGVVQGLLGATLVRDADGAPLYVLSQVEDITARKQAEEQLAHRALHDDLTGLPNRVLLLEHLAGALARSRRTGSSVGVLFIDLDDFKSVNDSLGHAAGDEFLRQVAVRIRAGVRASDFAARMGGDEFVVVCENLNEPADAGSVAAQLQRRLATEIRLCAQPVTAGASVGIALGNWSDTPESVLRDADSAMYVAKGRGGRRWEPADRTLHLAPSRAITLEAGLRRALEHQEFLVYYQPLIELRTGAIVAVEALLRWQHPEQGLLLPGDFIDVAEQRGLIGEIDAWVLDTACAQAATWLHRYGPAAPSLAINVSSRQLGDSGLAAGVNAALAACSLPPDRLCLEITGSRLPAAGLSSTIELHTLTEHGVRIAVDDFGTGYTGIEYLRRLPARELKIDRSFIDGVGADPTDTAVTAGLVALGLNLGLTIVAEGIETSTQRQTLLDLGCAWGQGWLWHPALPSQKLGTVLADHSLGGCPRPPG